MTKEQYHALAPSFDLTQHRIEQAVATIDPRLNPTGNAYRKKLAEVLSTLV